MPNGEVDDIVSWLYGRKDRSMPWFAWLSIGVLVGALCGVVIGAPLAVAAESAEPPEWRR